jgi:hypothetical protein
MRQRLAPILPYLPLLLPLALILPALNSFPYPGVDAQYSDLSISHYPYALYLRQTLLEGRLPLWMPGILSGAPFFANPLAGLWYPPGWLALLLPLPLGFNLVLALHCLWGGMGMLRLLRSEDLSYPAAMFGALAVAFLPKWFAHYGAGHLTLLYAFAWTPWLLWASGRLSGHAGNGPRQFAHWEAVFLAFMFLADVRWGAYAGILWWGYSLTRRPLGSWGGQLLHLVHQTLLAALLAAPLALPLLEYTPLSSRSGMTAQDTLVFSLPPARLLGLLFPDWGGFHEYMLYPGQAVLILGMLAFLGAVTGARVRFWKWTTLLALIFALGANLPLLAPLARLPGLDLLRVPSRALFIAGMALAALAAHTLARLLQGRLHLRRLGLALAALATFELALAAGVWAIGGSLPVNFAWAASFALAVAVWVGLRLNERLPGRAWLVGLVVLAVLDWAGVDRSLFVARDVQDVLAEGQPVVGYLAGQSGPFRVYSPSYSLPQQTAAHAGLQLADGVDPLQLQAYIDFMQTASGVPWTGYSVTVPPYANGEPAADNRAYLPDPSLLGLLNVRYVAAEYDLPVTGLKLLGRFGQTRLYENELAHPRAWLVPPDQPPVPGKAVQILRWRPEKIELDATGPGLLVVSEIAYPGWRARVDGQSVPLETVFDLLRGVQLPEGNHRIILGFYPFSLFLGLGLCGIAGLWMGWSWRRR